MLLLGVIASVSFSAITGLQGNLFQFQSKSSKLNHIVQVRELIKNDFNAAFEIIRTNNGFIAQTSSGTIEYQKRDSKLYRIKNAIESEIELDIYAIKTYFLEEIQLIPDQKVDAVSLEFESKTPLKIYLKKRKSLAQKINEKLFADGY